MAKQQPILEDYKNKVLMLLTKTYPNIPQEQIQSFVNALVKKYFQNYNCTVLYQPQEGNLEIKKTKLGPLLERIISKQRIITPSGSIYKPSKEAMSIYSEFITIKQKLRKAAKKVMLQAEAKGDTVLYRLKDKEQMNIKIEINAISGVMLAPCFTYSPWNYNAITSIVRHAIAVGYSCCEKFYAGNMLLHTENSLLQTLLYHLEYLQANPEFKEHINNIIKKYKLFIPSSSFFLGWIKRIYKLYNPLKNTQPSLDKFIYNLDDIERAFIFYNHNFYNLIKFNESYFKPIFDNLLELTLDDAKQVNLDEPLEDEDLVTFTMIKYKPYFKDAVTLDDILSNPEYKKILYIGYNHLNKTIWKHFKELFETFMYTPILPLSPYDQHNLIRKNVVLSDTDSTVFSLSDWIQWYFGKITFEHKAITLNALLIYLGSKYIEKVFINYSKYSFVEEHNLTKIKMKNEYFFPIFVKSIIRKHYVDIIHIREGVFLEPYKLEIKGKNYTGSDVAKSMIPIREEFFKWFFDALLENNGKISIKAILEKVIEIEQTIKTKIQEGDNEFFNTISMRREEEYKTPLASNYFLYILFTILCPEQAELVALPSKFMEIPLAFELKANNFRTILRTLKIEEEVIKKFEQIFSAYPKKKISRLAFPVGFTLPNWIYKLIDYDKIIYKNCFGIYLFLTSLNIGYFADPKKKSPLYRMVEYSSWIE